MTRQKTTIDDVLSVAQHYGITPNGYAEKCEPKDWLDGHDWPIQVDLCLHWLANCQHTLKINDGVGSYHLKHVVERLCGHYVCNGALLVACHMAGMKIKRYGRTNPNASINISKADARFSVRGAWSDDSRVMEILA